MCKRIKSAYFQELPGMTSTRQRKIIASARVTPEEVDKVAATAASLGHSVSTMRTHYNKRKEPPQVAGEE